jgi:hypothetical protein
VHCAEDEEKILVSFDPETGLLSTMESMRFKEATSEEKTIWLNEALEWRTINGNLVPTIGAVTWYDEGTPWATFFVEDVGYNVDVQESMHSKKP